MTEKVDLQVRAATIDDLPRVAWTWHESAAAMDGAPPRIPAAADLLERAHRELGSGWRLLVAIAGDDVIGLLAIKPEKRVLDQLFVHPSNQGRGVGTLLLDAAKGEMASGFTLRMAAANESARRFYLARGLVFDRHGRHSERAELGYAVEFYRWIGNDGRTRRVRRLPAEPQRANLPAAAPARLPGLDAPG